MLEGHKGYGEPPDIRRPAREFYYLTNQNPMAVDGNDDLVRPMGARATIRPKERVWGGQKLTMIPDKLKNVNVSKLRARLLPSEIVVAL